MAIFKKDGSVYKLNAPNPAMENQEMWTEFVAHNLKWEPENFIDENILKEISLPKEEKPIEKPKTEKPIEKPVEKVAERPVETKINIKKDLIHCLPAETKVSQDDLYNEKYVRLSYKTPFVCEVFILEITDLNFVFWTNSPDITVNSVIYPKNKEKRWWRVQQLEEKTGGWIFTCIPSDYQPSF